MKKWTTSYNSKKTAQEEDRKKEQSIKITSPDDFNIFTFIPLKESKTLERLRTNKNNE